MSKPLRNSETRNVVTPVLKAMASMGYVVVSAPGRKPMRFSDVAMLLSAQPKPRGIVWRQNTGFASYGDASRGFRPVRFGVPGMSDIGGILRDGRLLAIECKAKGKKVVPGSEQDGYLKCVRWMDGVSLVIHGGDDIVAAVESIDEFVRVEAI